MKKLLISSLFLFSLSACPPLPRQVAFSKIEYQAFSRGSSQYILLEKGSLKYVLNQRDTVTKKLQEHHYKALYSLLKEIDLSALESLKVPSTKHQTDAALAASLAIIDIHQKEFVSPTFDDNNPPKEIKDLVEYLRGLTQE